MYFHFLCDSLLSVSLRFSVFGSVFARRSAVPGVSFGDSLGDMLGGLGPHMLCKLMFQRFSLVSADCVLGGPWDVLGGAFGVPRVSRSVLGASLGLLGDPWRHLEGPWLLLGCPWTTPGGSRGVLGESLSGPSAAYATHTDVSEFVVFPCSH